MQEIWKPIEDFESYEISSLGRVRNVLNRNSLLRPHLDSSGYLKLDLAGVTCRPHRLVAEAFLPNVKQLPFVNHKDGVKFYNWVDNLEWCTETENNLHAVALGLSASGEAHYKAVLTEQDIPIIRGLIADGVTNADIAKLYRVHRGTISEIKRGNSWKHVK